MKKVLCINASNLPGIISVKPKLVEGNTYTVCESNYCKNTNMVYYWLLELPINRMYSGFACIRFVDCAGQEKENVEINTVLSEQNW